MKQQKRGQAVVEFALIAVMLVVMVAGAIDFGRAFSANVALGNMARAGAQYGSIANLIGNESMAEALNGMESAALAEQQGGEIYGVAPSITPTLTKDDETCVARVTVSYDYTPLFNIVPASLTLERTAEMRGQVVDQC